MVAFFLILSGKVQWFIAVSRPRPFRKGGEKMTLTQKRGRHAHRVDHPIPSYRCVVRTKSVTEHG